MTAKHDDSEKFADAVRIRLIRLKARFAGIVTGTLLAVGLFVATNWLIYKGGPDVGRHLQLLGQYFIGYRVTFVGSLVGGAYAFVLGFVGGYAVARMYNGLAGLRDRHSED
ncbi:MAG: hypothetical protein ABGX16_16055 [Pirellulales bacterium]